MPWQKAWDEMTQSISKGKQDLELGDKIMDIPDAWGAPLKIENEKGAAVFHFTNGVKISVPLALLQ